ncbi:MAG: hypothetical protein HYZ62_00645 [Candidatus Andersenbacteria bacterium]|nr:hypothetical protein [Candidatus Andersenbacteria bacterium]
MKRIIPISIGVAVLVLVLAWGAISIGNVGVRRVKPLVARVALEFSQPLLPGVLSAVHWNVPATRTGGQVLFEIRTAQTTAFAGTGVWRDGVASIFVPCDIAAGKIGLEMVDGATKEILASTQVDVLPAGPDCVR